MELPKRRGRPPKVVADEAGNGPESTAVSSPAPVVSLKESIPRAELWSRLKRAIPPLDGDISRAQARALVDGLFIE